MTPAHPREHLKTTLAKNREPGHGITQPGDDAAVVVRRWRSEIDLGRRSHLARVSATDLSSPTPHLEAVETHGMRRYRSGTT